MSNSGVYSASQWSRWISLSLDRGRRDPQRSGPRHTGGCVPVTESLRAAPVTWNPAKPLQIPGQKRALHAGCGHIVRVQGPAVAADTY
jgi:hypothetical protein